MRGCRIAPLLQMPATWFPEQNTALPSDSENRSAQKWNGILFDSIGNRSLPCFPENCQPLPTDDIERSLKKIDALQDPNSGNSFSGNGNPNGSGGSGGVSACVGATYHDNSTGDNWTKTSGGCGPTGWTKNTPPVGIASSRFDGINQALDRTGNFSGAGNSNQFIIAFWFKLDSNIDTGYLFTSRYETSGHPVAPAFVVYSTGYGTAITITVENWPDYDSEISATALAGFDPYADGTFADGKWHHFLASFNTADGSNNVYVDDNFNESDVAVTVPFTIPFAGALGWEVMSKRSSLLNKTQGGCISQFYFNPVEFMDFSVDANRRNFINADLTPVDMLPFGIQPTGTQPVVFMEMDPFATAGSGQNNGTGGNMVTLHGNLDPCGPPTPPGPTYNITSANFGAGQGIETNGNLVSNNDSTKGLVSFWINGNPGSGGFIVGVESFNITITDSIVITAYDVTHASNFVLTSGPVLDGNWHHVVASWDTVAGVGSIYVDDAPNPGVGPLTPEAVFLINYHGYDSNAYWLIGENINNAIGQFYLNTVNYLDLSIEGSRRKFITQYLKPVNLGPLAENPTGAPPLIYMPLNVNDGLGVQHNYGYGEGFDNVFGGPLTDGGAPPV